MKLKDDPKAYAIMGCAMRVHDTLGNGFLESAYADALELEFKRNIIDKLRRLGFSLPLHCFALFNHNQVSLFCSD